MMKKLAVMVLLLITGALHAAPEFKYREGLDKDPRWCGPPARTAAGKIKRSRAVLREFAKIHPCPATMQKDASCVGWAIDHVIPLACGGCDAIHNLAWMPDTIKSCSSSSCKDRWERTYHCEGVPIDLLADDQVETVE